MVKSNNLSTQKTVLIIKPFEAGAGAGNDSGLQLLVLLLLGLVWLRCGLVQVHYHGFALERHFLNDRFLVNDLLLVEGSGNFVAGGVKVAELLFLGLHHEGRFFHHLDHRLLLLLLLEQLFGRLLQYCVHAR